MDVTASWLKEYRLLLSLSLVCIINVSHWLNCEKRSTWILRFWLNGSSKPVIIFEWVYFQYSVLHFSNALTYWYSLCIVHILSLDSSLMWSSSSMLLFSFPFPETSIHSNISISIFLSCLTSLRCPPGSSSLGERVISGICGYSKGAVLLMCPVLVLTATGSVCTYFSQIVAQMVCFGLVKEPNLLMHFRLEFACFDF